MNTNRDTPPSNLRSLQARIDNEAAARNQPVRRIMRAVANVAIGQMLPPSVVKGGTAMKLRVGEPGSRFTPDFDASRSAEITLETVNTDYSPANAALIAVHTSSRSRTRRRLVSAFASDATYSANSSNAAARPVNTIPAALPSARSGPRLGSRGRYRG